MLDGGGFPSPDKFIVSGTWIFLHGGILPPYFNYNSSQCSTSDWTSMQGANSGTRPLGDRSDVSLG